jgi:hypothetical protein
VFYGAHRVLDRVWLNPAGGEVVVLLTEPGSIADQLPAPSLQKAEWGW